jgi:hypothetical protein
LTFMTLAYRRHVWVYIASTLVLVACQTSRRKHPLELANPGATFEVRLAGCMSPGENTRRFGSRVRTALLWSSERVHNATYLPCTATIEAVTAAERHAIYRVSRTRDGAYVEQLLRRMP